MACVDLFKCLLPYYLITTVVWLCVYLFKCLLPYYYGSMATSLNAYYLIFLLLLVLVWLV